MAMKHIVPASFDETKNWTVVMTKPAEYWEFWELIVVWLEKEIGPMGHDWTYKWNEQMYCFYFKHEEDKVKFILKWL